MRVFFDTSALAKRYVEEKGSARVHALCSEADALGVSVVIFPELISTLRRLVREGHVPKGEYSNLKAAVKADLMDADLCDLTDSVLERAIGCLERNSLRTLDAIHLASALTFRPDLFVSADRRQIEAARQEGLPVEYLTG